MVWSWIHGKPPHSDKAALKKQIEMYKIDLSNKNNTNFLYRHVWSWYHSRQLFQKSLLEIKKTAENLRKVLIKFYVVEEHVQNENQTMVKESENDNPQAYFMKVDTIVPVDNNVEKPVI